MTNISEKIFKLKYASTEKETWQEAAIRVATYVSSCEESQPEWLAKFYQLIYNKVFIPGGRILANSGTNIKNLMNCFLLPIEDSRSSIYKTLADAAEIFAWGGGIGYNFSSLREEGALINTTGGKSSGPLSFMSLFDDTGEVIQQASRRGAQMGILNIDHPDILKFITHKSTLNAKNQRVIDELNTSLSVEINIASLGYGESEGMSSVQKTAKILGDNQLTHFNISVSITDKFMEAVIKGESWCLISPSTGEVVSTLQARNLFHTLAQSAWESGDPGVFFYDRVNIDNMKPDLGALEATNPCGEVPLLPYEPCCLGSINLHAMYDNGKVNYEFLESVVRTSVRFLDNVQTLSVTPIEKINETSKALRRIGLGVMGWADLLAELGIPYDSEEAQKLAEHLSWFISFFAWSESMILAEERGAFPAYEEGELNQQVLTNVLKAHYPEMPENMELPVRNISVTSIAPTGSIALIAGVNSSIEPFYKLAYTRNITEGIGNKATDTVYEINSILMKKLKELDLTDSQWVDVLSEIRLEGSLADVEFLSQEFRDSFKVAHELDWKDHVLTQASWQKYTSNAVSKTINLPNNATVQDVEDAYMMMWEQGLKGGTVYRDGSKSFQILN